MLDRTSQRNVISAWWPRSDRFKLIFMRCYNSSTGTFLSSTSFTPPQGFLHRFVSVTDRGSRAHAKLGMNMSSVQFSTRRKARHVSSHPWQRRMVFFGAWRLHKFDPCRSSPRLENNWLEDTSSTHQFMRCTRIGKVYRNSWRVQTLETPQKRGCKHIPLVGNICTNRIRKWHQTPSELIVTTSIANDQVSLVGPSQVSRHT